MTAPSKPLVWVNISTSVNWNRPAVGIVRVERALSSNLPTLLGVDQCRLCVWKDDRFIEWIPSSQSESPEVEKAIDAFLPRGPSFDLARPFLSRALQRFSQGSSKPGASGGAHLKLSVPLAAPALQPRPGDILISVGLDWDMPYSREFYKMAKRQGLRIVTCCYDLIPVLFPHYCVGEVAKRFTEYFLDLSWGSEAVLCISEQTRRDYESLCALLGAPMRETVVIPLGDNIPKKADSSLSDEVLAASKEPFILFVSTIERRKNHEVLYRAYHLLARQGGIDRLPKLVFVGMHGWGIGDLMKDIELDPLTRGRIVELNHVTDGELRHLYQRTVFCVYPSLYEGWGLPVGEALSMGKAVISSDEGSLPEVGGDLVKYVPAWNPYAWAEAIREYVEHPELVAEAEYRVQSGYKPRSWTEMANRVAELVREMAGKQNDHIDLLPGYEMSTHCGIHSGPSILSVGEPGLLLFGPHIAAGRGEYSVTLSAHLETRSPAFARFSVASSDGRTIHADRLFALETYADDSQMEVLLHFTLGSDVPNLEVKCEIEANCQLRIDRVTIRNLATHREHRPSPEFATDVASE